MFEEEEDTPWWNPKPPPRTKSNPNSKSNSNSKSNQKRQIPISQSSLPNDLPLPFSPIGQDSIWSPGMPWIPWQQGNPYGNQKNQNGKKDYNYSNNNNDDDGDNMRR